MALTKITGKGITDLAVDSNKLANSSVTSQKLGSDSVTSAKISDGVVSADDLASTLDLSSKTVTLPSSTLATEKGQIQDNIALLGFKMAVNDGLTVFNLVDGVVDEFNDESGTDESEGSNDTYCATSDFYKNANPPVSYSAGFSTTAITEPDTSTAGTNPAGGSGTLGEFTVPTGMTSLTMKVWGAGGSSSWDVPGYGDYNNTGGAGGFATGILAVTGGQSLHISAGEGGYGVVNPNPAPADRDVKQLLGGGTRGGAGAAGVFAVDSITPTCHTAPQIYMVAGGGGASGGFQAGIDGGVGGGTIGGAGGSGGTGTSAQTSNDGPIGCSGGGGSQTQGGQSLVTGPALSAPQISNGSLLQGGLIGCGGGTGNGAGSGFYGGGAGGRPGNQSPGDRVGAGGGGSSYVGHPQISSGSTEAGEACRSSGGSTDPDYSPIPYNAGEGGPSASDSQPGQDGYVLLSGTACGATTSTTIVSTSFTSNSVATSARIVVFEEDVDSPTLNTDIIASVSRDGGSNYTNATLSDSGYVTGSSGQRILTGQADISGQPSGQSMRWKLALANNTVKIHGVALQWS